MLHHVFHSASVGSMLACDEGDSCSSPIHILFLYIFILFYLFFFGKSEQWLWRPQSIFSSLWIFLFFLWPFTFENGNSAVCFSMWKLKICQYFNISQQRSFVHSWSSMKRTTPGWQACRIPDSTHRKCDESKNMQHHKHLTNVCFMHSHFEVFTLLGILLAYHPSLMCFILFQQCTALHCRKR
jgi:energy-coupling factor transporter transmembrane protein EcfT